MDTYQIGDAAKAAGVGVQTLHYYEREGLIAAPERSSSGYRQYDSSAIATIRAIKRAQTLGFTLAEIKELMSIGDGGLSEHELLGFVDRKLAQIDEKIALLRAMKRGLRDTRETCCCGGDLSSCVVLEGLLI